MFVEILKSVVLFFLGGAVTRFYERRQKLIAYFQHISAFKGKNKETGQNYHVFTHSVILRNSGNLSATNVRIHHKNLPDFSIYPDIVHSIDELENGTKDIVIPTMVPREQITISYLYFPPMTYSEVNDGIKSDQGFAKPIDMVLQPRLKKWFIVLVWVILLVGIICSIYFIVIFSSHLVPFFSQLTGAQ